MPDIDTSPAALRALSDNLCPEPGVHQYQDGDLAHIVSLLRAIAAEKEAATVKPDLTVGATDRLDALALWRAHGGDTYGPRVEHVRMPLSKFDGFVDAALAPLRASLAAAEKERDEALRDAIKFTQKVDAGLVRDEEYLRLHREKMEQYDRRVAAEARAEKAEAERDAAKDEAANFIFDVLQEACGNPSYNPCDGTETWEGDVAGTVYAILNASGLRNEDTGELAIARAEKAEAERDAARWQPIETAPRDGTRLWCFWPDAWSEERQAIGWFVSGGEDEYWTDAADSDPNPPTHWMPLPAAPATRRTPPMTDRPTLLLHAHSIRALQWLAVGPVTADALHPSIRGELRNAGLAEAFDAHGVPAMRITEAGRERLREIDNAE